MTTSRSRTQPWLPFIAVGLGLQLLAAVLAIATNVGTTGNDDHARHSTTVLVFSGFVGAIGIWIMVVGVIALGVQLSVGTTVRHLSIELTGSDGLAAPLPTDIPIPTAADFADDPFAFDPHPGDSDVVAEIRVACGYGETRSAMRGIVRKAAREKRLTPADHALIEGLLAEAERRRLATAGTD